MRLYKMQIPLIQSLVDQTYKANQLEFTWRLPTPEAPTLQVVLEVNNRGVVRVLLNKMVQFDGDFVPDEDDMDFMFTSLTAFEVGATQLKEPEYKKLTNDQGLVQLAKEVVEYLK